MHLSLLMRPNTAISSIACRHCDQIWLIPSVKDQRLLEKGKVPAGVSRTTTAEMVGTTVRSTTRRTMVGVGIRQKLATRKVTIGMEAEVQDNRQNRVHPAQGTRGRLLRLALIGTLVQDRMPKSTPGLSHLLAGTHRTRLLLHRTMMQATIGTRLGIPLGIGRLDLELKPAVIQVI